ncbi:cupin domain-containing protein [Canibacter sp. lx-45]|uniref:cupin domain-containing protein n=1 Tax=Canibacter zhuwentaonis TaxID=2837491 RepID=UPI001BDD911C|nr:cupin domain-containing protein [Canibacter zhuwentaonis]
MSASAMLSDTAADSVGSAPTIATDSINGTLVADTADGSGENIILGQDVLGGEVPQVVVPGGCFHGSRSLGAWTLLGTTMAPPFSWEQFTLAERAHLLRSHPRFAADIARLTRD